MMSIGIGRMMLIVGGLWVIADECEDEGGRRPGQQETMRDMKSVFVGG